MKAKTILETMIKSTIDTSVVDITDKVSLGNWMITHMTVGQGQMITKDFYLSKATTVYSSDKSRIVCVEFKHNIHDELSFFTEIVTPAAKLSQVQGTLSDQNDMAGVIIQVILDIVWYAFYGQSLLINADADNVYAYDVTTDSWVQQ